MTNEEKQLLIKDLCARLPYHVIVEYRGANVDLTQYAHSVKIENCKPYLRPMSSMTEEEKDELNSISHDFGFEWLDSETNEEKWKISAKMQRRSIDFYNAHHLDYRGLIEKGLALEAPEDMYNTK